MTVVTKYYGKVCTDHPEDEGLRYRSGKACPKCVMERHSRKRNGPDRQKILDHHNGHNSEVSATLKREVMDQYGGVCQRCQEADIDVLTIDHIDGGGAEHRRTLSKNGRATAGITTYRWLKKNGFPAGFRVLCANCNIKVYRLKMRGENELS